MLLVGFSCIVGLLLVNAGLIVLDMFGPDAVERDLMKREAAAAAAKDGTSFDSRSRAEVVAALEAEGLTISTLAFPYSFLNNEIELEGKKILPLSACPNTSVVHSNEGGYYPLYEIDELGFNNPRGVHSDSRVEMALLGDSFTFGFSVDYADSLAGQLQKLSIRSVSLGHGGNGPLLELATLSEFGAIGKYKYYVWLYCGWNDLDDLLTERYSAILNRYLDDPTYRQGLADRFDEMKNAMENRAEEWQVRHRPSFGKIAMDMVLLRSLRGRLGWNVFTPKTPPYMDVAPVLEKVLRRARTRVEENGGRFLVVYLPSVEFFQEDKWQKREIGLEAIRQSGAEVLDMKPVFEDTGDPQGFFPYRMPGHYTPQGYALVAQEIEKYVSRNKAQHD
jgi:hypothetical protein